MFKTCSTAISKVWKGQLIVAAVPIINAICKHSVQWISNGRLHGEILLPLSHISLSNEIWDEAVKRECFHWEPMNIHWLPVKYSFYTDSIGNIFIYSQSCFCAKVYTFHTDANCYESRKRMTTLFVIRSRPQVERLNICRTSCRTARVV